MNKLPDQVLVKVHKCFSCGGTHPRARFVRLPRRFRWRRGVALFNYTFRCWRTKQLVDMAYHPHARERGEISVGGGMVGALIVIIVLVMGWLLQMAVPLPPAPGAPPAPTAIPLAVGHTFERMPVDDGVDFYIITDLVNRNVCYVAIHHTPAVLSRDSQVGGVTCVPIHGGL